MRESRLMVIISIAAAAAVMAIAVGCGDFGSGTGQPLDGGGPPPDTVVSFRNQILPLFAANCGGALCHTPCSSANSKGLCLASHQTIMASNVVLPGDAENSAMVKRLEGRISPRMPYGKSPLSDSLITLIRRWIDQGAVDDSAVTPPPP